MSTGEAMHQLQRMTLSYSLEEDRVQLLGLTENSELLSLWFTRRLASNLLNHFKRLDTKAQLESGPLPHLSLGNEDSQPPVTIPSGEECVSEFSVIELEITQMAKMIGFVFRGRQVDQSVQLVLGLSDCETWLAGLGRLCEEAGWMLSTSKLGETPTSESIPTTVTIH